ncbi:MAG TPA: RES domain-containing protein [Thermohalobaculum sp.]|nr:RES domain-containing protein [Thermohalobaculum sp.]
MTPLPPPLGDGQIVFWRLDHARHAETWGSGEGSFLVGGRWNARGRRVVYAALDPSTAILEVAVHKTFRALDTVPHVLTHARITEPECLHVVRPDDLPNPNWLFPGQPSAGQQAHGDGLLSKHLGLIVPSVVSKHSWNIIFDVEHAEGLFAHVVQEPFALDPRLHPPAGT